MTAQHVVGDDVDFSFTKQTANLLEKRPPPQTRAYEILTSRMINLFFHGKQSIIKH
jgi:hypothetical protein